MKTKRVDMDKKPTPAEAAADAIANKILDIQTLDERKRDQLDFHEVHVTLLKEALVRAYELGREAR